MSLADVPVILEEYNQLPQSHRNIFYPLKGFSLLEQQVKNGGKDYLRIVSSTGDLKPCWGMFGTQGLDEGFQVPRVFYFIFAQYRNRGYGRPLVDFSLRFLRDHGYSKIELRVNNANKAAIRLYENSKFRAIDNHDETITYCIDLSG